MVREILVVPREKLFAEKSFQGFMPLKEQDFTQAILDNFSYKERDAVENNIDLQQPIPYVWIVNKESKEIFAFQRAKDKNYNESRLRGRWSCGVGGHIDKETEETSNDPILDAMIRELYEEVVCQEELKPKIIGFIKDDSDSVGQFHFGVVAIAETKSFVGKGDEEIAEGRFFSVREIESLMANPDVQMDNWTRISWPFIKSYLCNGNGCR